MLHNKFTKFKACYLDDKKTHLYSYMALDEEKDACLMIKPGGWFNVKVPASIEATCGGNYHNKLIFNDMSEEQFWAVFKSYTLLLYQYYQEQISVSEKSFK